MKKIISVISVVLGLAVVVGISGYLINKSNERIEKSELIKLDNKLLIGTYKESISTNKEKSFNRIYIEIINEGKTVHNYTYETNNLILKQNERFPGCVFVDLSTTMETYAAKGIYLWSLNNEDKNYISVRTEYLMGGFISEEVRITDSGFYRINIPKVDNEKVQVEHSYVYESNKVKW